MNLLDRIDAKMELYSEMSARQGASLAGQGWTSEHDLRKSIWRCLVCRRGDDCRTWLAEERQDAPDFCANAETFARRGDSPIVLPG